MITFHETHDKKAEPYNVENESDSSEVKLLEDELIATREDLQSTIGELEASNEDLKTANEEVMSINEELQSANEELETSKEELQSLNEELATVNNQLQDKISDLVSLNNDMTNLLNSTNIAIIFRSTIARSALYTLGDTAVSFDSQGYWTLY